MNKIKCCKKLFRKCHKSIHNYLHKRKVRRNPTFFEALIPIFALIIFLGVAIIKYDASPHIPLILSAIVAGLLGMRLGHTWASLKEGIIRSIKSSLYAVLILMIVGTLIGTWMLAGIVPIMIYYGLQLLHPSFFLLATAVICCVVSIATGSSWTTAGTVGIALIGIGSGLGIPLPIVVGAIISGAYFGDKMSPLSDTTNLAPAMAGSRLFVHIKHMIYTTGPSLIIALILYTIIGLQYNGDHVDSTSIKQILNLLSTNFNLNPILFIVPIIVIVMVIMKVPAIPALLFGSLLGGVFAFFVQGASLDVIIQTAQYGYVSETGFSLVDSLLSRGGMDSMMWTIGLILCALSMAGVLEKINVLSVIANKILEYAKSSGSLILITLCSCIFTNLVTGDQYLAIVVPGKMYKKAYEIKGLHPKNLSRALEDSGTLVSPLIPWSSGGAYMWSTLGVSPALYFPYAFLNLLNPVISAIYGFTGFTIEKIQKKDTTEEDKKKSKNDEPKPPVQRLNEHIREIEMPFNRHNK